MVEQEINPLFNLLIDDFHTGFNTAWRCMNPRLQPSPGTVSKFRLDDISFETFQFHPILEQLINETTAVDEVEERYKEEQQSVSYFNSVTGETVFSPNLLGLWRNVQQRHVWEQVGYSLNCSMKDAPLTPTVREEIAASLQDELDTPIETDKLELKQIGFRRLVFYEGFYIGDHNADDLDSRDMEEYNMLFPKMYSMVTEEIVHAGSVEQFTQYIEHWTPALDGTQAYPNFKCKMMEFLHRVQRGPSKNWQKLLLAFLSNDMDVMDFEIQQLFDTTDVESNPDLFKPGLGKEAPGFDSFQVVYALFDAFDKDEKPSQMNFTASADVFDFSGYPKHPEWN